jgi:5-deoxy-glucuronate isomerase
LVPKGYHPVAAPPGFKTYYLNVMAGHHRVWKYTLDEDYVHIAPKDGNIMGVVK